MTGPASDDYILVRDSDDPAVVASREAIDAMWPAFAPHADPDFREDAKQHFRARFREMYLYTITHGIGLGPSGRTGGGPDLLLRTDNGQVSMEAVAAECGEGADHVPPAKLGAQDVPREQLLLRYSSVLKTKSDRGLRYLSDGVIGASEAYVVAINGAMDLSALVDTRTPQPMRLPRIVSLLYGVGPYTFSISGNGDVARQGYAAKPSIAKCSGALVGSALFRSNAISHVSAVLFGLEYPRSFDPSGAGLLLVHNPFATNPTPRGLIPAGVEYWMEGSELRWKDWSPGEE